MFVTVTVNREDPVISQLVGVHHSCRNRLRVHLLILVAQFVKRWRLM